MRSHSASYLPNLRYAIALSQRQHLAGLMETYITYIHNMYIRFNVMARWHGICLSSKPWTPMDQEFHRNICNGYCAGDSLANSK